jgi:hypothetical protein
MCPLENQSSAKDLQQSLVQKSNEYKLAYIGTVYFKKKRCQCMPAYIHYFSAPNFAASLWQSFDSPTDT